MINATKGDMFATPFDVRINTVNIVGVMGAGIALAFKRRYPDMFLAYQADCRRGLVQPGKMHLWTAPDCLIVNFPTKRHWRDPSRYEDIESGLDALRTTLKPLGAVKVALPALGCGQGGLDWTRVSAMISQKLDGLAADIRVFTPADSRLSGRAAR